MVFFVGVYVKFDGLMYPQLNHNKLKELQQSKEESKQSLWTSFTGMLSKLKNVFVSSGEDDSKHMHLPTLALRVYLSKHHRILTGKVFIKESPVEIIADIIDIFNSLHKAYLQIDSNCRALPNSDDVQKVCFDFCHM